MRTVFELGDGLALAVTETPPAGERPDPGAAGPYPTSGLQKGLLLLEAGQELSSEGVGAPVVKRGPRDVAQGAAQNCRAGATVPHEQGDDLTVYGIERDGHWFLQLSGGGSVVLPMVARSFP